MAIHEASAEIYGGTTGRVDAWVTFYETPAYPGGTYYSVDAITGNSQIGTFNEIAWNPPSGFSGNITNLKTDDDYYCIMTSPGTTGKSTFFVKGLDFESTNFLLRDDEDIIEPVFSINVTWKNDVATFTDSLVKVSVQIVSTDTVLQNDFFCSGIDLTPNFTNEQTNSYGDTDTSQYMYYPFETRLSQWGVGKYGSDWPTSNQYMAIVQNDQVEASGQWVLSVDRLWMNLLRGYRVRYAEMESTDGGYLGSRFYFGHEETRTLTGSSSFIIDDGGVYHGFSVNGVEIISGIGTLLAGYIADNYLTGLLSITEIGNIVLTYDCAIDISGIESTTNIGTLGVSTGPSIFINGVYGTTQIGNATVNIPADRFASADSVSASGFGGTIDYAISSIIQVHRVRGLCRIGELLAYFNVSANGQNAGVNGLAGTPLITCSYQNDVENVTAWTFVGYLSAAIGKSVELSGCVADCVVGTLSAGAVVALSGVSGTTGIGMLDAGRVVLAKLTWLEFDVGSGKFVVGANSTAWAGSPEIAVVKATVVPSVTAQGYAGALSASFASGAMLGGVAAFPAMGTIRANDAVVEVASTVAAGECGAPMAAPLVISSVSWASIDLMGGRYVALAGSLGYGVAARIGIAIPQAVTMLQGAASGGVCGALEVAIGPDMTGVSGSLAAGQVTVERVFSTAISLGGRGCQGVAGTIKMTLSKLLPGLVSESGCGVLMAVVDGRWILGEVAGNGIAGDVVVRGDADVRCGGLECVAIVGTIAGGGSSQSILESVAMSGLVGTPSPSYGITWFMPKLPTPLVIRGRAGVVTAIGGLWNYVNVDGVEAEAVTMPVSGTYGGAIYPKQLVGEIVVESDDA